MGTWHAFITLYEGSGNEKRFAVAKVGEPFNAQGDVSIVLADGGGILFVQPRRISYALINKVPRLAS